MSRSELVDIEADLIRETKPGVPDEGAYLIDAGNGDPVWVPKSLVEYDRRDGTFTMPRRIAEEKGLV